MNLASPPPPHAASRDPTDRVARLCAALVSAYLAATLWPMLRYVAANGTVAPLALHLGALAVAIGAIRASTPPARVVRDWVSLALRPLRYIELRWLIPGAAQPHRDLVVQRWEQGVFHGQPSVTWAP